MITVQTFVFNPFQQNTYVLYADTSECVIIDPGMNSEAENAELLNYIDNHSLKPVAVLTTHCHVDHILGSAFVKKHYNIPLYIHSSEADLLERAQEFGSVFGLQTPEPPAPTGFLELDKAFQLGNDTLELLHVPGHSTGSVAYYSKESGFVITGDALFSGSIGRTDLPGGDYQTLIDSIREKLLPLPDDTRVYPGHGPYSTIGKERSSNPFLN